MSQPDPQKQHSARDLTSHIDEDDLWELDDDWTDADSSTSSEGSTDDDTPPIPPAPESVSSYRAASLPEPTTEIGEHDTFEPDTLLDHEIDTGSDVMVAESQTKPTEQAETSVDTPPSHPAAKENEPAELAAAPEPVNEKNKGNKLNPLEKVSLSLVAAAFLGAAIWAYLWLYDQNIIEDEGAIQLPLQGEFISISDFSTHWVSASQFKEIKMGAKVLPAASMTLDDASPSSGALRIYFRNVNGDYIGDSITLTVRDGQFTNSNQPNTRFDNDHRTATVIASDGFHQEGDFNAYVLDEQMAWKIQVLEAKTSAAAGKDFEEIIHTKVGRQRK
ncbi:hypothetical protein HW115_01800 [Verrucomicrobiaceae bacterium N1E253]|uniref:Uncharacterized protein n=1 Tax=Oceaniferula marina TaxID=2748318 RepID=A0A851GGR2_9BACT|nr:hypothetical protein [Oceaniferula marina]NWK54327.1 hypothetical protein [Oceaniferula marina]